MSVPPASALTPWRTLQTAINRTPVLQNKKSRELVSREISSGRRQDAVQPSPGPRPSPPRAADARAGSRHRLAVRVALARLGGRPENLAVGEGRQGADYPRQCCRFLSALHGATDSQARTASAVSEGRRAAAAPAQSGTAGMSARARLSGPPPLRLHRVPGHLRAPPRRRSPLCCPSCHLKVTSPRNRDHSLAERFLLGNHGLRL